MKLASYDLKGLLLNILIYHIQFLHLEFFLTVLFDYKESKRLFWSIHHLAVDGVSWRILLEDFQNAYLQIKQGHSVKFAQKTSSFKRWSEKLSDYAKNGMFENELNFWKKIPETTEIPLDYKSENSLADVMDITVMLDQHHTDLLLKEASFL
ncbi:MAG: hypothetical protein HQK79_15470 [Desulfobacterales bacterium]|nr:hypothetical protein [Desulfobacterales bacterium]